MKAIGPVALSNLKPKRIMTKEEKRQKVSDELATISNMLNEKCKQAFRVGLRVDMLIDETPFRDNPHVVIKVWSEKRVDYIPKPGNDQ